MSIKNKLIRTVSIAMAIFIPFLSFSGVALAGPMTARSLALTNASPSATGVTYTFTFTIPSTTSVHHVDMEFDTNADMSGSVPVGLNTGTAGSTTLSGTTPAFAWTSPIAQLTWTTPSVQTAGSKTITLTNVTNPSTTAVFYAKITSYANAGSGTPIDTGTVASATVPVVVVSGTQLESLTASVAAKTSGTVCSGTTVLGTTTATAINFGTFTGTTAISAAQTVTIGSNATSGVSAKIIENQLLTGPTTIADYGGTTDLSAGSAWTDGVTTGFGICAKGGNANTTNFGAGGTLYMGMLTTAKTVASTTGPTVNTGTDIEFRVAVPSNLQAGTYTNTLTYNILANY